MKKRKKTWKNRGNFRKCKLCRTISAQQKPQIKSWEWNQSLVSGVRKKTHLNDILWLRLWHWVAYIESKVINTSAFLRLIPSFLFHELINEK